MLLLLILKQFYNYILFNYLDSMYVYLEVNNIYIYIYILIYKMPTKVFYQVHREGLLQNQRDFYGNNKEMIKKQARIKHHSLSPEEKNKKNEYTKNWYNNLPED